MMNKTILTVDLAGQIVILNLFTFGIIRNIESLDLSLFVILIIFWQLASSIYFTVFQNDRKRKKYFYYIMGYFALLGVFNFYIHLWFHEALIVEISFIPILFAAWYFLLTVLDLKHLYTRHKSFWDL